MGNRKPKIHKQSEQIILIEEEEPAVQQEKSAIKQPNIKPIETPQPEQKKQLSKPDSATVLSPPSEEIITSTKQIPVPTAPQVEITKPVDKPTVPSIAIQPSNENPTPTPTQPLAKTDRSSEVRASQKQSSASSVKIKMNEKLQLATHDGKVKNVNQYGQVVVESNELETVRVSLMSDLWHNKKVVMTRITPNSFKINPISDSRFEVEISQVNKGKGVIDYFILKESFNEDKIPLMFIYSQDSRKSNNESIVEYIFKYKVNEKWKEPLHDIEIDILIDHNFIFSDCKTTPLANSLQGKRVNWKAKHLAENAKGKLSLTFIDGNLDVKEIIKEIRLHMRSEKSLIKELNVSCEHAHGKAVVKRNLLVEYKILPN